MKLKLSKQRFKMSLLSLGIIIGLSALAYLLLQQPIAELRTKAGTDQNSYDVVVAGAGSGGVGAAIQAARQGASVLLIDETDYIGGQMTAAGVSTMDYNWDFWTQGIFTEFRQNVDAYYRAHGKTTNTCYFDSYGLCFEPHVGREVLIQMIQSEPNITLQLRTKITNVDKEGNKVAGVVLNGDQFVSSKVLIDATEYGDVIPLTGADYRVGNGTNTNPSADACIQDITYTAVVKKYPQGVPAELKITQKPPGYTDEVEALFKEVVHNSYPSRSDPWSDGAIHWNWETHAGYRGIPDSSNPQNYTSADLSSITKTGINRANDYPAQAIYVQTPTEFLSTQYLEDKAYRKQVNCEAKLKTIQFLYYMQNGVAEPLWSVANDEGYDTAYNREENDCSNIPAAFKPIERQLPVIPYVRESRRIIGENTYSSISFKRLPNPGSVIGKPAYSFPSSIAVSDYSFDMHNCDQDPQLETELESRADLDGYHVGPFQIPMDALIPSEVDGFLAAEKNISVTRLASGGTRLQPITMLTGQAAGSLAAEAAQNNIPPREVDYRVVQEHILQAKGVIVPFKDVPTTHPYFESIQRVVARGILHGYGDLRFGPDDWFLRRYAAALIVSGFNIPLINPETPSFADMPKSDSFYKVVETIYDAHITSGCGGSPLKFCPSTIITKEQWAVFLLQAWHRTNPEAVPVSPSTPTYSDVPTSRYTYRHIEGLANLGVNFYCDLANQKFCPTKSLTRGEAVDMTWKILNLMEN